jgi:hypothetical protein
VEVQWIAIICAVAGSAFGGFVGVRVAIASLKERVTVLESEVKRLRDWRHDEAAQFMTRHELDIEMLKRKVG